MYIKNSLKPKSRKWHCLATRLLIFTITIEKHSPVFAAILCDSSLSRVSRRYPQFDDNITSHWPHFTATSHVLYNMNFVLRLHASTILFLHLHLFIVWVTTSLVQQLSYIPHYQRIFLFSQSSNAGFLTVLNTACALDAYRKSDL